MFLGTQPAEYFYLNTWILQSNSGLDMGDKIKPTVCNVSFVLIK